MRRPSFRFSETNGCLVTAGFLPEGGCGCIPKCGFEFRRNGARGNEYAVCTADGSDGAGHDGSATEECNVDFLPESSAFFVSV